MCYLATDKGNGLPTTLNKHRQMPCSINSLHIAVSV